MTEEVEEEPRSEWSKPWFIRSAVFVGLLVVGLVAVVVISGMRDGEVEAAPAPAPQVTAEPRNTESCAPTPKSSETRILVLPDVNWEHEGTVTFPTSAEHGPRSLRGAGVRTCFTHSPEGAVFAATAGMAALDDPTSDLAVATAETVFAPGPVRDEMVSSLKKQTAPPADAPQVRTRFEGFKLLSYDGENARVDLGVSGSGLGESVYLSMIVPLKWVDNDWQLAFDEVSAVPPATLPTLAGYTMWPQDTANG